MKEMQERLAEDPELAAAYRAAHERYLAGARRARRRTGDRGHLRRRHARPGQVPARAGRPVARAGPGREPARRRGARPARRVVEERSVRGRVAAIDCGTNTIKLLIGVAARGRRPRDADGPSRPGPRPHRPDRGRGAGAGVRRDRRVRRADRSLRGPTGPGAVRRDLGLAGRLERRRTSSLACARGSGSSPRWCPATSRRRLSFDGAVRNLRTPPLAPVLVIDIGGGSTELILGSSAPEAACSMDIGSVRLHERHLHSDPPTADEVAACVADIDAHLDACPVDPALGRDRRRRRRHRHPARRRRARPRRPTPAPTSTRSCSRSPTSTPRSTGCSR